MANTAKSDAYKHKKALQTAKLTKAQQEKLTEWHLIQEMGNALGLEPPKPIVNNPLDKRTNTRIELTPGLTVVLSVRRSLYAIPFHKAFKTHSIMRFTAVMEAEKQARSEGLEVMFLISAENEESEVGRPLYLTLAEKALARARTRAHTSA